MSLAPSLTGMQGGDTPLHVWARRWVAEQWPEWWPRTRPGGRLFAYESGLVRPGWIN
jgi:hypothetical protein